MSGKTFTLDDLIKFAVESMDYTISAADAADFIADFAAWIEMIDISADDILTRWREFHGYGE